MGVEAVEQAGKGVGDEDDALRGTQGSHAVQQFGVGNVCIFSNYSLRSAIADVHLVDVVGTGGIGVRRVGGGEVAGDDVEEVGRCFGDAEKSFVVGEVVHEYGGAVGCEGVDLVEVGGAEEGDKDFAVATHGEVLDPCVVGELVDDSDGKGQRLGGGGGMSGGRRDGGE